MKPFAIISGLLAVGLAVTAPPVGLAHVGHGDEFQAQGGIERVPVNPETDGIMGIVVAPIASAANGSSSVMVPVTALVDADGKQLVFVQYENFYEPVEVTTGATEGELIEITQGLSVGEKLVTQGSLSLYAESRKTQTADSAAGTDAIAASQTEDVAAGTDEIDASQIGEAQAQANSSGTAHSDDTSGNLALESGESTQPSTGFPMATVATFGGGTLLVVGAIAAIGNRKKGGV